MDNELPNEATLRNLSDREFIRHIIDEEPSNYFAVQAALRFEAYMDAIEEDD